jgi:hypothetical protein
MAPSTLKLCTEKFNILPNLLVEPEKPAKLIPLTVQLVDALPYELKSTITPPTLGTLSVSLDLSIYEY